MQIEGRQLRVFDMFSWYVAEIILTRVSEFCWVRQGAMTSFSISMRRDIKGRAECRASVVPSKSSVLLLIVRKSRNSTVQFEAQSTASPLDMSFALSSSSSGLIAAKAPVVARRSAAARPPPQAVPSSRSVHPTKPIACPSPATRYDLDLCLSNAETFVMPIADVACHWQQG